MPTRTVSYEYGLDENSAYLMNLKKEKEGIHFWHGTRAAVV